MAQWLLLLALWWILGFHTEHHKALERQRQMVTNTPDTLFWDASLPLHWVDFKGEPAKGSPFTAFTSSFVAIKYTMENKGGTWQLHFITRSGFDCRQSWVKRDQPQKLTERLLKHEQLHFDITELTRRKLNQKLGALKLNSAADASKVQQLYSKETQAGERMQNRYDLETRHGLKISEQLRWETDIAQQLQNLAAFE